MYPCPPIRNWASGDPGIIYRIIQPNKLLANGKNKK
jgi:hypothetical protein